VDIFLNGKLCLEQVERTKQTLKKNQDLSFFHQTNISVHGHMQRFCMKQWVQLNSPSIIHPQDGYPKST
jgi:hypothetical protein